MTREELYELVRRIRSDTLIACRMYDALNIPRPAIKPRVNEHAKTADKRRYRGARKLMKQRYGVDLR